MDQKWSYCNLHQRVFCLRLSLSFILCILMFRSIIHFEPIFHKELNKSIFSFIYMEMSSLPSATYWKLFLYCAYCLLCHRWVDHTYVGLLLEFLSCSIDLYSCFCVCVCQHHTVLITIAIQYSLESGNLIPLAQFLFVKIFLAIWGLFVSIQIVFLFF